MKTNQRIAIYFLGLLVTTYSCLAKENGTALEIVAATDISISTCEPLSGIEITIGNYDPAGIVGSPIPSGYILGLEVENR